MIDTQHPDVEPFDSFGEWLQRQELYRPDLLDRDTGTLIDLWKKEREEAGRLQRDLFDFPQDPGPGHGRS